MVNLQKTKSRQLKLFKFLLNEYTYKPSSHYSNLLSVSQKTIYNDIIQLNKLMNVYQITIHKSPRKGILLLGNKECKEEFQRYFVEKVSDVDVTQSPLSRRMEIVREIILYEKEINLCDLETQYFVTSASLRTDLGILQEYFKPFQVTIYSCKNKIFIKGKESAIQKSYKNFLLDFLKPDELYDAILNYNLMDHLIGEIFDKYIIDLANETIGHLVDTNKSHISDYYVTSLYLTLMILISRVQHHHHLNDSEISDDISYMEPYVIAYDIAEAIEKVSGLQLERTDICYLSEQLFAHRVEPSSSKLAIADKYVIIVNDMIANMSTILEVDLTDDVKLRNSLLSHIPPMIYRLNRKIKVANPLLNEIKKQYIVLFSLTWYIGCDLEHTFDVSLDDDEISFLFVYFQVSLEKRHGVHFKNILIVCPIGLATSELIFNRVRQILPSRDNIITMNVKQLQEMDLDTIDFVISTVNLQIDEQKTPVINVSPLVNDNDMNKITQFYSKLNKQMNTLQQVAVHHSAEFNKYLSESYIFWNQSFKSKEECLNFVIDYYEKDHFVNNEFRASIYQREEMGDTSVYTGVAMPHAFPETVNKTRITIVTLKDKIKWGVNDVKIVILIAIAKQDINQIGEVLSRLLAIIESTEMIDKILKTKHKKDLVQLLRETL